MKLNPSCTNANGQSCTCDFEALPCKGTDFEYYQCKGDTTCDANICYGDPECEGACLDPCICTPVSLIDEQIACLASCPTSC
jgi:hypothetical protein